MVKGFSSKQIRNFKGEIRKWRDFEEAQRLIAEGSEEEIKAHYAQRRERADREEEMVRAHLAREERRQRRADMLHWEQIIQEVRARNLAEEQRRAAESAVLSERANRRAFRQARLYNGYLLSSRRDGSNCSQQRMDQVLNERVIGSDQETDTYQVRIRSRVQQPYLGSFSDSSSD